MVSTLSAKTLGQRIRQIRIRRGLTQQDLAGEDYSKSYISAIEQGKTRPSLKALQRIAARLEVPAGTLLDPEARGFGPIDETMPKRVRRRKGMRPGPGGYISPSYTEFQLARAELLIMLGQPTQALEVLRPLIPTEDEPTQGQTPRLMESAQVLRMYHLAAKAAIRGDRLAEAHEFLRKAIQLAERVDDREEIERLRNLLGVAYYQSGQVLSALEEHKQCLAAVQAGRVQDPNFKLAVYNNIARDYAALHDNERAMATYKDALTLIESVNDLERQANIFVDLSTTYANHDDYWSANRFATKATGVYQVLSHMQQLVRMQTRYAELLIDAGQLEEAERCLMSGLQLAEDLGSNLDRAMALANLARVSLQRGNDKEAQERSEQAVQISRQVVQTIEAADRGQEGGDGAAAHYRYGYGRAQAMQVLAKSLAIAGEVAAKQGEDRRADKLFEEAIKILSNQPAEVSEISSEIYESYARLLAGRGQHERAATYFEQAYRAITRRPR
jgi:tetratricopeptide (TPR) repeat protein